MHNKVKIIDFNRRSMQVEQAEKVLEDLLDEGYSIVTSTESDTFTSYTLVKRELDVGFQIGMDGSPAPAYFAPRSGTGDPIAPRGNTISNVMH